MDEELNELTSYLKEVERTLEGLKTIDRHDQAAVDLMQRYLLKEGFSYQQQLEEQMRQSRSLQAREFAKVHLDYFHEIESIFRQSQPESRDELAYLYGEFSQEFIYYIVYKVICYYLECTENV